YSINADERDVWLQCGMAIKDHFGDSGRPLWNDWSRRSTKFDERDQDTTWRSFKRNGITIATVFYQAKLAGWRDERIHHWPSNGVYEVRRNGKKPVMPDQMASAMTPPVAQKSPLAP